MSENENENNAATTEPKPLAPEQLRDLRSRMLKGYEPSDEEISCVLQTLRGERSKIGEKKTTQRTQRKPIDLKALFAPKEEKAK